MGHSKNKEREKKKEGEGERECEGGRKGERGGGQNPMRVTVNVGGREM